jgi:hypothetical protein
MRVAYTSRNALSKISQMEASIPADYASTTALLPSDPDRPTDGSAPCRGRAIALRDEASNTGKRVPPANCQTAEQACAKLLN